MEKVLLMYSGGRDSTLAACRLAEQGYFVYLVNFSQGAVLHGKNAAHGAERLMNLYGKDHIEFLGNKHIAGIWRDFIFPVYNKKPSEILNEFGELTISQFNCLACRSAMYVWCVIKAKKENIRFIAEGARADQGFCVQMPGIIQRYKNLLAEYGMELLTPVYDLNDDWERKNQLLARGFVPKTLEPQCLIGIPMPSDQIKNISIQDAAEKVFDKIILPKINECVAKYQNINYDFAGELCKCNTSMNNKHLADAKNGN